MAQSDKSSTLPGSMPGRLPENAPAADFDAVAVAKALLRVTRAGALGTIDRNTGHPFGSLVNVATDVDGSPLILVSRLATHTANLEKDGRTSLLLVSPGRGDPLAHPRLTVLGTFAPVGVRTLPSRICAGAFWRVIQSRSCMPASQIFRSGDCVSCRLTSMPASPARPI